jgi:hypothetical protein
MSGHISAGFETTTECALFSAAIVIEAAICFDHVQELVISNVSQPSMLPSAQQIYCPETGP